VGEAERAIAGVGEADDEEGISRRASAGGPEGRPGEGRGGDESAMTTGCPANIEDGG
jgi:hypothetical protein